MKHISVHTAQKDFSGLMNGVTTYNEPVTIVSDDDKSVVLLSMEEWNGIQETIYLQSIPGVAESIKKAASEPLEDGIPICLSDIDKRRRGS
jgi:prevent-host-death family protein